MRQRHIWPWILQDQQTELVAGLSAWLPVQGVAMVARNGIQLARLGNGRSAR
jgi:hypothetical protein